MDGWEQADDQEAGKRRCGRGQKAEVISGDSTVQEGRGQAGSVTSNQTAECWRVLHG